MSSRSRAMAAVILASCSSGPAPATLSDPVPAACPYAWRTAPAKPGEWDYRVLFEEGAALGGRPVRCFSAGALELPSGRLVLHFAGPLDSPPLALEVTPGRYPVFLTAFGPDAAPAGALAALVVLAASSPVRWAFATTTDEHARLDAWEARTQLAAVLTDASTVGAFASTGWVHGPPTALVAAGAASGVVKLGYSAVIAGYGEDDTLVALVVNDSSDAPIAMFSPARRSPPVHALPPQEGTVSDPCPVELAPGAPPFLRPLTDPARCRLAGALAVTSGRVVATDPLVSIHAPPFAVAVPRGRHPVVLGFVDNRPATALLAFGGPAAAWGPGYLVGEPNDGNVLGFPVDSGTAAFVDLRAADEVLWRTRLGPNGEPPAYDLLAEIERATGATTFGAVDLGEAGNLVAFRSGYGDGTYATWLGRDATGNPVALAIDFALEE